MRLQREGGACGARGRGKGTLVASAVGETVVVAAAAAVCWADRRAREV